MLEINPFIYLQATSAHTREGTTGDRTREERDNVDACEASMAIFAKRPSPHQPLDERKIRPLSGSDSISGKTLLTLLTLLVVGLVTLSYSGIVPPPLPESPSRPSEPSAAAAAAAVEGDGGGERAAAEEGDASSPWEHDGDVESEHDGNSEALQLAVSQHVSSSGDGGDEAAVVAEDEAEAEGGGGKNAEKIGEGGQSGSPGEEGEGVEGPEGDDVVDEGGDGGEAEGDTVEALAEGEEGEGEGASDALDEGGQDEDEGGQGSPGAEAAAKKPKVPNRCAVTPEVVAFTMNQLNNTVGRPARGRGWKGRGYSTIVFDIYDGKR